MIDLSPNRRDALRWIAAHEPVGLFPGKPSLAVVRKLHADGFLEALRPKQSIDLIRYRLTAAGHAAKVWRLPIVMCAEMVGALWDGRKTMTRRINHASAGPGAVWARMRPGDLLWVREAFGGPAERVVYPATGNVGCDHKGNPIRIQSGRFMPRKYSRITLRITAAPRIEPVMEICAADVRAEGCANRDEFVRLWISLHKPEGWIANPDVVVIPFEVIKANIDAMS